MTGQFALCHQQFLDARVTGFQSHPAKIKGMWREITERGKR